MEQASVVTDQQLRASFRAVIGKSESVIVREDKKIWRAFHAQLPGPHKPITREQSKRCAEAEGLVYEGLQPWGFCLYRKDAKRPEIRLMAYAREKGLHYVDAPASGSASTSKGATVEPGQAIVKNDVPQAKPAQKKTFKTPRQIAADAVQLVETARAEGRILSSSDAVNMVLARPGTVCSAMLKESVSPHSDEPASAVVDSQVRQVQDLVAYEAAHGRKLTNAEALAIVTQKESAEDPKQLARRAQQYVDAQAALGHRVTMAEAVSTILQTNH